MRLTELIRTRRELILTEWETMVRELPAARTLPTPALRDHLPELLDLILQTLDGLGERSLGAAPDMHALDRLSKGFGLEAVVAEYRMLRETVLRLWAGELGPRNSIAEVLAFDGVIDRAIGASVDCYARMRERTFHALDAISLAALGQGDLDAFLPRLMRVLLETVPSVDTLAILLREGDRLHVRAAVGLEEEVELGFSLAIGEGFAGTIAADRRPLLVHDVAQSQLVRSDVLRACGLRVLYGVPLMLDDELVGVAHMGSQRAADFSEEDKLLFRTMAHRATGLVVQKSLQASERAAVAARDTSLAMLDSFLATAPVGFAVLDRDLHYVRINETLATINGHPVEAHRGRAVVEVIPDFAPHVMPILRGVLDRGESVLGVELRRSTPGAAGRALDVLCSYFPIRSPGGEVWAVGAVITDITEQKRATEQIRRELAFRERFIAILSHDLRTPLSAILGTADMLLHHKALPEDLRRPIQRIVSSSHRMSRMIRDLLDFARTRAGQGIPVAPTPLDLATICASVVDELAATYPGRSVKLSPRGGCEGRFDPDRIAQVVQNLVVNALDYSPPDTPVEIEVGGAGARAVMLHVRNQGDPIPPEILATLFDPFKRGGQGQGLGLGLYIAHEIVGAHGGDIQVASEAGRGTTFTVTLPRA